MPVVINEFEAIAESQGAQSAASASVASGQAARLDASALRLPLRRLARRHERLKAH